MANRLDRSWCVLLGMWAALSAGCGDDPKTASEVDAGSALDAGVIAADGQSEADANACDPKKLPKLPNTGLEYPNSYCDDTGCKEGACDPLGRCEPACNAWAFEGSLAFQAVKVKPQGTPGPWAVPEGKDGEDVCPGKMITPVGTEQNCCQSADNSKQEQPGLRMTSLVYTRPTYFNVGPVANATKMAFEEQLYNMVSVLSSGQDGPLTVTSGSATVNADGTYSPMHGAFKSGDVTLNADGAWDALSEVPAELSTKDGVRTWSLGPTAPDKDFVVIMWIDDAYDFARMELHLRELRWTVPLDDRLNCAGERSVSQFDLVGHASGFVPLEDAIKTEIWITRESSLNLCSQMSGAASCKVPVEQWKP